MQTRDTGVVQSYLRSVLTAAVLAGAALLPAPATAAPAAIGAQGLAEHGSGKLTWLRLRVYDAQLYTPPGGYRPEAPAALVIRYGRDIPRTRLIEATADAWERTRPAPARTVEAWLERLSALWPDVARGDEFAVLAVPGEPTVFFFNDAELGRVEDPAFGPAFLGVWLHPQTPSPKLRRKLLGETR